MGITGLGNTYQQMMNHSETQTLKSFDFGVLSRARVQFSLFHIYSECDQVGTQMGFKLVRVGSSETRKLAIVGFRKHSKKRHQKSPNICSNMLQKEGPQK